MHGAFKALVLAGADVIGITLCQLLFNLKVN
jgi:hypothetical protein